MRTFEESEKSKKTVGSMIERKKGEETKKGGKVKSKQGAPIYLICLYHIYMYIISILYSTLYVYKYVIYVQK